MILSEYTEKRAAIVYRLNRPETETHINAKVLWFGVLKPENIDGQICLDVHTHSFYEVFFMFDGKAYYECADKTFELESGTALFIPPNTPHRYLKSTDDFLKVTLAFSFIENESAPIALSPVPMSFDIPTDIAPNVNYILSRSENKDVFVPKLIGGRVLEIIYSVCKALGSPLPQAQDMESDPRVIVAKQFIESNKSKIITTDDVAKECCLCTKQLGRIFKNEVGCTVYEYIINSRVKYAKNLLMQKHYTIKEISYMLGFENESSFVSFFKRHYGTPPGAFRRNNMDV